MHGETSVNSSVMHDKTHLLRPTYPGRGLSRARRQPLDAEYRISDAPCRSCPREFVCGENYQLFQRLVVRECGQTRRPHEASCDRTALAAPLQRCIPMSLAYVAHITTYIRHFAVFISSEIMIQRFVKISVCITFHALMYGVLTLLDRHARVVASSRVISTSTARTY